MTVHLFFLRHMTLYLYCILIYIFLFLSFNSTQVHSWNVGCLSNAWRLEDMVAMHFGGWDSQGILLVSVSFPLRVKLFANCNLN